jgi:flagellar biosynthesis/type III secretory pathway protein FliH
LTEGHHEGTGLPGDEALEVMRQQAYEQGLNDGRQQAQAEHLAQSELQTQTSESEKTEKTFALLEKIQASIEGLHEDPASRYEPLKRLALHLAEQLVLTELSTSPKAINHLVQRCVDALDQPSAPEVLVELNTDDLAMLQSAWPDEWPVRWRLQAHPDLLPGSVQVIANDAMVCDLIEHRLQSLARELLGQPGQWQAQTAFTPEGMQMRKRHAPIEDVQTKSTSRPAAVESDVPATPAFQFPVSRADLELEQPQPPAEPPLPDEGSSHDD